MRWFFLFFFAFPGIAGAVEELTPAQPLPLTLQPSPELDPATLLFLQQRERKEPQRNLLLFHQHQFPWFSFTCGLFLATLSAALLYVVHWYRTTRTFSVPQPLPIAMARKQLDLLEQSQLPDQQEFDAFFTRLTGILRQYIEQDTGIRAAETTSPEFLAILAQSPDFTPEERQLLTDLLTYADQVKFAKRPSTSADCALALSYGHEFLDLHSEANK